MHYKIIETGEVLSYEAMRAHFPNVSIALPMDQAAYDHLGIEEVPDPDKTPQEVMADCVDRTQTRLDSWAHAKNYDGILSAGTYATSSIPQFKAEGQLAVDKRDATWAALYAILAEVQAETRPMPKSFSDIEGELPVLEWV